MRKSFQGFWGKNGMKKMLYFLYAIIITVSLTACGEPEQDTFIEGMDYQYPFYDRNIWTSSVQRWNDAVFIKIGYYIYKLDEKSGILTPLCNRPNCLHNHENDPDRVSDCNAYIKGDFYETGIACMDGYLYAVADYADNGTFGQCLCRISEDGSKRENVYTWKDNVVEEWCVHRNAFYYVEHAYDENNHEQYAIKELKLAGGSKGKMRTIYEPPEGISVYSLSSLCAYGRHLYVEISGAKTKNPAEVNDDNWLDYQYEKMLHCDLQKDTLSEIRLPDQSDSESITEVAFWQDHIVFCLFDYKALYQYDAASDLYIADLDGNNAEVLLKDIPQYRWISSDGTYLYISDCPEQLTRIYHNSSNSDEDPEQKQDAPVTVEVYDRDMKLADTMQAPFHKFPHEPAYGMGDRMYLWRLNDAGDSAVLSYLDKSDIGTCHGEEYRLTEVCTQQFSELERNDLKEYSGE